MSLGGDRDLNRIKKSLILLKDGYSSSGKLMLTGYNEEHKYKKILYKIKRNKFIINKGIKKDILIFGFDTQNTYKELVFIMNFSNKNKYNLF